MIIDFEGRRWELDTEHIRYQHAMVIQSYTGMSMTDWESSLDFKADDQGNVINPGPEWLKSMGALYWLMLAQAGEKKPIAEVDFDLPGFVLAVMEASVAQLQRAQEQEASEPDPTSSPSSQPGDQLSPMPAYPTATTPMPPGQPPAGPGTGSTPAGTWPGYAPSTYSGSPASAISPPPQLTSSP